MIRWRWAGVLVAALAGSSALVSTAAGQNSIYGLAGIGFPGLPVGVRARALGTGPGAFDATSAVNPAAVARLSQLIAGFHAGTTFRGYRAGDSTVRGLRETRFPYGLFGGPLGRTPLAFALNYATYADRSFDITTASTDTLRGQAVQVTDRIAASGAVTDVRGALATQPARWLLVGGALHLIGGSSRLNVRRAFSDSAYSAFAERRELVFSGIGWSAGVILRPVSGLELAGVVRSDGRLTTSADSQQIGSVELPLSLSAGVHLQPVPGLDWSATASWRSWGEAQPDLAAPNRAFDTWEIGSGVELGRSAAGLPLRVGGRYRQLPFSRTASQATEWVLAAGTGRVLARGRAIADLAVERLRRSGGGAVETGWQVSVGLILVP